MKRLMSGNSLVLIGLLMMSVAAINFSYANQKIEQRGEYRSEVWRSLKVDEATKAFDATGSKTSFLMAASDGMGQHVILGESLVRNRGPWVTPWLARMSDDWVLQEPLLLTEGTNRVPRPEMFAISGNDAAYVENVSTSEKGGGVYSDFDLFDPVANERLRYYRFNFQAASSFHTRAGIVVVDRSTSQQTSLKPFGDGDARLTSLISTKAGFVVGGYVVPDGQLGTFPALAYVGGIERGERNPGLKVIIRIADALEADVADLFTVA